MVEQQIRNSALNSSFLVLNLGTNTLGVGNSFTIPASSESSHRIPIDKSPATNVVEDDDTISSSTEEGTEEGSSSESDKSKSVPEEKEDPDWVPDRKSRRTNNILSCRTAKPKDGTSFSSSSSHRGGVSGMLPPVTSRSDLFPPKGFNGVLNSGSGSPPHHLMELLRLFGWKVVFETDHGGYVYISPTGRAYSSLPQAFGTFLHSTSKYNEMASVSSSYLENNIVTGSPLPMAGPSGSKTSAQCGNAAADTGKKKRSRKKRSSTRSENKKPIEPIDEPLCQNYGKRSSQKVADLVCEGANRVVNLGKVNEHTEFRVKEYSNNELNQMDHSSSLVNNILLSGKLPKARRSVRTRGRHVPADNVNVLSGSEVSGGKSKDMKQTLAASEVKTAQNKMSGACRVDVAFEGEVRKSGCSDMGVNRSNQRRIFVGKDIMSIGLRRSGRLNKTNDMIDVGFDVQKGVEDSYLDKTKYLVSTSAGKDEGKLVRSDNMPNKKIHYNMNSGSSRGETQRLNRSSTVLLSESNIKNSHESGDRNSIRRSMRINGKRVPVGDDSDMEFEVDNDFLDSSDFGASIMAVNDKEKRISSFFEGEEKEAGNLVIDAVQLKQANINNSDCSNSGCRKVSASLKGIGWEIPAPEKRSVSYAARAPTDGRNSTLAKNKIKRRGGCGLTVRRNKEHDQQEETLSHSKISMLTWLIDCGALTENEKVYYITKNSTGDTATGFITRGGIWCNCCDSVVPLLKFIAHAGGSIQHPWDNIFLLSGKAMLVCMKEAWEREKDQRKIGFQTVGVGDPDPSDDTCGICADGGQLICCDNCPSTFHQNCVMLKALPEGSWFCPYCRCTFCMAAVHGPSSTPNFLSCKQCGRKYHQECACRNEMHLTGPINFSFCGRNCQKVAAQLSEMLGITNPMEGGFSWTLLKRLGEEEGFISNRSLSFILESNVKLSMALSILNECFVPLVDQRTGLDMICQAVYNSGSNFNRLNYEGYYTLILEKDEEIISAASLRIHGTNLAEMPFIGTRPIYRRQGMCRRLLNAVEDMLSLLSVDKLIIPAIPDLLETWMNSFSFKPLEPFHKDEIRNLSMMIFAGTTLLQKSISSRTRVSGKKDVSSADNSIRCREGIQEHLELARGFDTRIFTGGHMAGGVSDRWINAYNINERWDATLVQCRMLKGSSIASDSSAILPPFMNGSISEFNPVRSTSVMNANSSAHNHPATSFFPSTNVVLDDDPLGSETAVAPSNHISRWLQDANEMKDLQIDAIRSSLSFDSLLRMSS